MATTSDSTSTAAVADDSRTAVQRLREQADSVVERIQPQIAAVATYAREEPTKALLISAAAGAALMGLVALMVRSSNRSAMGGIGAAAASAGASAMAAIRDAALDLADSAQSMAADAIESTQQRAAAAYEATQKRAAAAFDSAQQRASGAAAAAAEGISDAAADAWQRVREQAAPVVDKVRPQIDAATRYVKEDPTRAALGLAVAGAVVAGLIALTRSSQDD